MKKVDSLCIPLIRGLGLDDALRLAEIKRDWDTLFGQPLCYHMVPCKVSGSEVLLNVDSPVWLQELQYHKKKILGKLSPYRIKSMRFKIGRVSRTVSRNTRNEEPRFKTLTPEEVAIVEHTVSQLNEKEMRETVQKAMKKSLSARKVKH